MEDFIIHMHPCLIDPVDSGRFFLIRNWFIRETGTEMAKILRNSSTMSEKY